MASRMYLKRLEIFGFKSFVKKTVFNLDPGITAIVGPNGCGKSNIIDAVRWVLGEQSAKSLRGARMEELIFHGSEKEKPLGMAEVSLVLDNESGTIPGQGPEVAITRRVHRSGESEYFLNKVPARLKDIVDTIVDTGISTEGYVIMEQGRIDAVLKSRPEDRMSVFEEAAGIMRYQHKKEETERRLEDTLRNLERVNDMVMELRRQMDRLGREAKQAEAYQEMRKRAQEMRARLKAGELVRGQDEAKAAEEESKKGNAELNGIHNEVAFKQGGLREARERLERDEKAEREAGESLAQIRESQREHDISVNSMRLQLQTLTTQRDERQRRLDDALKLEGALGSRLEEARAEEEREEGGLVRITPEVKRLYDEAVAIEAAIAGCRTAMSGRRKEAEDDAGALKDVSVFESSQPFETAVAAHESGLLEEMRLAVPAVEWPLSAIFKVDGVHAPAILAALGPLADSAVVDTWSEARVLLEALRGKRDAPLSVAVLEAVHESGERGVLPEGASKWADELVTCAPKFALLARAVMGGVAVADGEMPEMGAVSAIPMAYSSGIKITSPGVVWWPGRARSSGPSAPQMAGKLAHSMEELAALQADIAAREMELAEIRVREAEAKIESARLETRLEGARKSRRRLEEESSQAQEEVRRMRADLEGLGEEAGRIEEEIRRRTAELEQDRARYEELTRRSTELAALLPGTRESIGVFEREIDTVRGRADEISLLLREVETRLSAARARFEIAREEFAREFATDEARLEELASNPLTDEETNELARLDAKLADLGQAVYLGAVDEFNAIKARYENYQTQVEDLRKSRESLQRAIQRLDRESEKKFDETFDRIRANFNLMFRRMFGGGNADLVLQESEEGVRGVDIIAQPPGKRTQTITLLSGGEQTLISTSLLFALFMAKPSPFCLMDEIDAPLDDSNIDRFLKVVKEFSQATQFIIISHNKHTMEVVDNLYGITMEELGVSRIVSVRLKSLQPMGKG